MSGPKVSREMAFAKAFKDVLEPLFDKGVTPGEGLPGNEMGSGNSPDMPEELIRHAGNANLRIGFEARGGGRDDGEWMLTAVHPIAAMVATQAGMVRDLGIALGVAPERWSHESILEILLQAHGGRVPKELGFAGRGALGPMLGILIGEALGRSFSRVIGPDRDGSILPGVLAAWGKWSTTVVGRTALEQFVSGSGSVAVGECESAGDGDGDHLCDLQKIRILANFLKVEGIADQARREIISRLCAGMGLDEQERHDIDRRLAGERAFRIDPTPFAKKPERRMDLLMELIGLAVGDRKLPLKRTIFIADTAGILGLPAEETGVLLEEEARFLASGTIIPRFVE